METFLQGREIFLKTFQVKSESIWCFWVRKTYISGTQYTFKKITGLEAQKVENYCFILFIPSPFLVILLLSFIIVEGFKVSRKS